MAAGDYQAIDIAKYIIGKCTADNQPISNLQLQKILYFLQRKYLNKLHFLLPVAEKSLIF